AEMVARIGDLRYIVWEAPLKAQQVHLLRAFGPQVNLGNVPPSDVIALEATRRGLRGDTLRLAVKASLQREEERAASDAAALPALVLRINPPAAG
ncbi:MAG: phosphosulfolactate synthase, partial [Firmicutes bacterium]|nr:phosphosulfolactate synthase [Bacillota bacterium]